jgi:hypothetical protein
MAPQLAAGHFASIEVVTLHLEVDGGFGARQRLGGGDVDERAVFGANDADDGVGGERAHLSSQLTERPPRQGRTTDGCPPCAFGTKRCLPSSSTPGTPEGWG